MWVSVTLDQVNQLEKDGDVVAQAQAIASLEALKQHSFSIVNALNNILTDSKVLFISCVLVSYTRLKIKFFSPSYHYDI